MSHYFNIEIVTDTISTVDQIEIVSKFSAARSARHLEIVFIEIVHQNSRRASRAALK